MTTKSWPATVLVLLILWAAAPAVHAQFTTPPPVVTAADADWQVKGEPIMYSGSLYYPTGPTVFFDGKVMGRGGSYRGIPLYEDSTLTANTIVFVPIGRTLMRPYERRRSGELAGTTGSRLPSFPVENPGERDLALFVAEAAAREAPEQSPASDAISTTERAESKSASSTRSRRVRITDVESNVGIWIPFNGARWLAAGQPVPYVADQFEAIGSYGGRPVYRRRGDRADVIYIPSVVDGPLARYERH